jgi:hypothetical protein
MTRRASASRSSGVGRRVFMVGRKSISRSLLMIEQAGPRAASRPGARLLCAAAVGARTQTPAPQRVPAQPGRSLAAAGSAGVRRPSPWSIARQPNPNASSHPSPAVRFSQA